jgi:hypothetical protein
MRPYTTKEKAKITAGAVASLVIVGWLVVLERFPAKWRPVRVKKTRQIKNLEPCFDSIETKRL